ncbi:hypothetical protein [Thermoflavimicrobium daqui]|uniref:Uncharacterized protein n=1 Tax=Thermoflavimicrobium daqui TaxID=2137476 RepID=A0A364K9Q7_9BACL|nr:hypothetical protein [Thermoflavimicrobium daqui]RAL27029.1 hypothetical protein DL897_03050 [Thermoflavimicrobium daqui]
MNRKWSIYYFIMVLFFGLGRWWIIQHYQLTTSHPLVIGQSVLLYWVIGFSALLWGPVVYFIMQKLRRVMNKRIQRFRAFIFIYALFTSLIIFSALTTLSLIIFYRSLY